LQYDGSHYFLKVGGVATTGGTSFPVYVAGSVTANPTGTQTIAGTVTANLANVAGIPLNNPPSHAVRIGWGDEDTLRSAGVDAGGEPLPIQIHLGNSSDNRVTTANPLPISGTVTIGSALPAGTNQIGAVTVENISSLPDAGENPVIRTFMFGYDYANEVPVAIASDGNAIKISGVVTIGAGTTQIGSVTANSSNGSLTTRFGSVTTANTAFATSAVTNSNRKYLLIQNITTASNVITVGIGFTPTTTQGIQLSSGAGLTFEGSYIPTGAVNLLSSVTASCFTILEA
jgi:hypothetical protein